MMEQSISGVNLTSKQEAQLLFYYDEDSNLWLYLLTDYFRTKGESSAKLKEGIITNSDDWQQICSRVKESGFDDLKDIVCNKHLQWNVKLTQMFSDAGHVNLFSFYLRSLINLKTKKIAAIGNRGKTQLQINTIISFLANNTFSLLERYADSTQRLENGKSAGGTELSATARDYYEKNKTESLREVANLLGLLVIFKGAKTSEDVEMAKGFVRANMLKPLEIRIKTGTVEEKLDINSRINGLIKLLQAMDIQF